MKRRTISLAFCAIVAAFSPIHAQTTAFTYQGRLSDGGTPATGIYDLQFTVCDAPTNGNAVGGPLTNSATGVTNGLFCVTLDFGSGVFTGPNRWLEIATRTNGAAAFTTLAPRQVITPAPYAFYASSAGSAAGVSGSVSAGQISGTLALAQLPGAVLTNHEQGVNLAGTLTGNLIGNATSATTAANTVAFSQGDTNLDNATWLAQQASRQNEFLSFNRGRWRNTASKMAQGQPITIMLNGTGLIGQRKLDGAWTNLLSTLAFAGYPYMWGGGFYPIGGSPDIQYLGAFKPYRTEWPVGFWQFTNNGDYMNFSIRDPFNNILPWNVFGVFVLETNVGATFKLQTNNGSGGSYTDCGFSFNALSAAPHGSWFYFTNNAVTTEQVQMVQTSAGTNIFPTFAVFNNTLLNAMRVGYFNEPESGALVNFLNVATNSIGPFWAGVNADLILFESIEGGGSVESGYVHDLLAIYTNWTPNSDVIGCSQYPTYVDMSEQNTNYRTNIINFARLGASVAYFDGYTPFENTNNAIARGFYAGGAGDPHYGPTGMAAYGYLLSRWLDLEEAQSVGSSTLTGNLVGNATSADTATNAQMLSETNFDSQLARNLATNGFPNSNTVLFGSTTFLAMMPTPRWEFVTFNDVGSSSNMFICTGSTPTNWVVIPFPAFADITSNGLRDPSICRYNGEYLLAYTSYYGSPGTNGFGIATSPDGYHFTFLGTARFGVVTNLWAPEWFIDPTNGLHLTGFSPPPPPGVSQSKVLIADVSAPNFSTMLNVRDMGIPYNGVSLSDPQLYYYGGIYYLFTSEAGEFSSTTMDSGYSYLTADPMNGDEGPSVFRFANAWWWVDSNAGNNDRYSTSLDLTNWTSAVSAHWMPKSFVLAGGSVIFNQGTIVYFDDTSYGDGSGLTSLNATSLTGTLSAANLPGITTNVSFSHVTLYITNGLIMRVSGP